MILGTGFEKSVSSYLMWIFCIYICMEQYVHPMNVHIEISKLMLGVDLLKSTY